MIGQAHYWEIRSADSAPAFGHDQLLTVAVRLARIDHTSPRFPRIYETQRTSGQVRVTIQAVLGTSLLRSIVPGSHSLQAWAFTLREMLLALRELQYVSLSHGRIDTHSFRRQSDGRVVLDYFQPLAFAELPGESTEVYPLKSPERNRKIDFPVGMPSDLYAVGQLAKTMLERGVDPQPFDSDARLPHFRRILDRLTAIDPQDRYAHPESALHDLESLADPTHALQINLDLLRREPLPRYPELVGRQSERYRLTQAWSRARAKQPAYVILTGSDQISRGELMLHQHRELLLAGQLSLYINPNAWEGSGRGFVDHLLRAIAQRCEAHNEVDRLRGLLDDGLQELIHASPALQERFSEQILGPHAKRATSSLIPKLSALLEKLTPMAVFIPQAERCQGLAEELFRNLVRLTHAKGVLWVAGFDEAGEANSTSNFGAQRSRTEATASLRLEPQDLDTKLVLLKQHLGNDALPSTLQKWLGLPAERPVKEMLESLEAALLRGELHRANNRWEFSASARYSEHNEGLRPIILQDTSPSSASSPARTFLLRAAALGPGIPLDPLLPILSPNQDGARWLEYTVKMGAVVCYSDGAHRLAHHTFSSKLLASLTANQRKKLHSELFTALSRFPEPEAIPDWAELHSEQGYWAELHPGQRQRLCIDAIKDALAQHDREKLVRWYERWTSRAPEPVEDIQDYFTLSQAALEMGTPQPASHFLKEALDSASSAFETAQAKLKIAQLQLSSNDFDRAAHNANQALIRLSNAQGTPSMPAAQGLRKLHASLFLCVARANAFFGPRSQMAWALLRARRQLNPSQHPIIVQEYRSLLAILAVRCAPKRFTTALARRLERWLKNAPEDPAQLNQVFRALTQRNIVLLFCLADDPGATCRSFERWCNEVSHTESFLDRRTILLGARMVYANLGAYAVARDCLSQIEFKDRYPEEARLPSALTCSIYNAQLALGESAPPRVPIAFEQAPRGTQISLMALEIERLCHLGELSAARTVARQMERALKTAPLMELPLSSQLGRVCLAYALIHHLLSQHDPTMLRELTMLRKHIGSRISVAPSHNRVLTGFLLFFAGRYQAALRAFDKAESIANRQRALLALYWIERGRSHIAAAQNESPTRVAKLAQSAVYYAEQMPSARLKNQVRDAFGQQLRAARAWTALPGSAGNTRNDTLPESPITQSLTERFDAFHRAVQSAQRDGPPLYAFIDALLAGTQAQRAAVLRVRELQSLEVACARDRNESDLSLDFDFDKTLVERCIATGRLQHSDHRPGQSRKVRSAVAAPYRQSGNIAGVVYLDDPSCHFRFASKDRAFVAALTPQLPLLIELDRLTSSTKAQGFEVQNLQARSEHFAQAFAQSEAKREQLLTYVHEPVVLIDANHGELLELSASARELLRDSRDKLVGVHYAELFPSAHSTKHRELLSLAVETGKAHLMDETLSLPGGQTIPVNIHLRSVDFGGLRAIQATFEDLRERNHLQKQIRKAQKVEMMGTLASGIAHDFNNFLGAISSMAEELPAGNGGELDQRQLILDTVSQASTLTKQLLDLTRERRPRPRPLDLHTHVQRIIKLLGPSFGSKIRCHLQLPDNGYYVYIDQSELTQVILNLVVNARDAMPDGGTLTLSSDYLEPHDETWDEFESLDARPYCVLSISDTGTGIPEALLNQIFDAFFTTKASGNGLGLATVRELVTRNHGSLSVHSEVYQGTTFKIALPAYDKSGRSSSPSLPAALATRPTTITPEPSANQTTPETYLLYVEDDDKIRSLTTRALTQAGYNVKTFAHSVDALTWYDQQRPSLCLLLSDVHLPRVSGPELCRALRRSCPDLPVVFLTGAGTQTLKDSFPEGEDDNITVLQKPCLKRNLLRTLQEVQQKATRPAV